MTTGRDIEHRRRDEEIDDPWAFEDPRLNRTAIPYTDDDTAELIDRAVKDLTIFRGSGPNDAGAVVSVLVSLAGEAEGLLFDAVADARDHGYTWDEIADRLATSITTARRHYAAYANWRRANRLATETDRRTSFLDKHTCIPPQDPITNCRHPAPGNETRPSHDLPAHTDC